MGFWSSVGSFCSSVASTVSRAASSVWEKTKEIASDAISWLADEAEAFVGSVKETWKEIKPYLVAISPYLKMAAKAVATSFPWLSGAILILDKTLQALLALENSPILKKIEKAIQWTIAAARKLKDPFLTPEEVEEAKERKATFRQAAEQMSGEEARALELAAMINDYALVQTAIKNIFETNSIKDFDHYLRLRATQKLLANVEKLLTSAQSIEDISNDDIFMLGVGAKLLAENPDLSDADVIRLDAICVARFNKKLIPFVFEEMVMAWSHNLSQRENDWTLKNKDLAKEVILLRRLEIAKKLSELALDEETVFADLSVSVAEKKKALDALAKQNREMKNYVYAAEGFLQLLEKSEAELDAADQHYLIEEGGRVGMIIINCAQHGTPWEELTGKEQSLIIDFANIFEQASQERAKQLIEVMAA